jgi:quercetin dioxygenase-like cupin family protein
MKNKKNRIESQNQYSRDIEGYFFEGADGSQIAFWTCRTDGVSAIHTHPFDEYMVCVYGKYTLLIGSKEVVLEAGDEFHVPKGMAHACRRIAGTRTIHAFGGRRIQKTT